MIVEFKEWVKQKLIKYPKLRDSNERLYYKYLTESGYDTNKSIKEFLQDMENREIKYLDSIGRASRLIQEKHPNLRGSSWKERKKKSVKVKHEILGNQ